MYPAEFYTLVVMVGLKEVGDALARDYQPPKRVSLATHSNVMA